MESGYSSIRESTNTLFRGRTNSNQDPQICALNMRSPGVSTRLSSLVIPGGASETCWPGESTGRPTNDQGKRATSGNKSRRAIDVLSVEGGSSFLGAGRARGRLDTIGGAASAHHAVLRYAVRPMATNV